MKKIFKQIFSGMIASSIILLSFAVLADDTQTQVVSTRDELSDAAEQTFGDSDDLDSVLSEYAWEVVEEADGSTKPFTKKKGNQAGFEPGITTDLACETAPQREGDAVVKYSGISNGDYVSLYNALTYGEYISNLDTVVKTKLKDITAPKIIIEFDVMSMIENTGMYLRHGHVSVSGAKTYNATHVIRAGKEINVGEWTKISIVIGNTAADKTSRLYINGKLKNEATMDGYGINNWCLIVPYVGKGKEIECYVDNVRAVAASDMVEYSEAELVSNNDKIKVENGVISGIDYGMTSDGAAKYFEGDIQGLYFAGKDGRTLAYDAVIDSDTRVAAVSADGIYTYYSVKVKYIPGDIYKKVAVVKNGSDRIIVKNLEGISDSSVLIYASKNGVVQGNVYVYPTQTNTEITFDLAQIGADSENVKVLLLGNVSNMSEQIGTENSGINIDLAVESGVTVSGTASKGSEVFMIIMDDDQEFDSNAVASDGVINNYYSVSSTSADSESGQYIFDLVSFESSGNYTYIIYADGKAYTASKFAPGISEILDFKEKIGEISGENDLKDILDNDSKEGSTGLDYLYYNTLDDNEKLKVCADIIEAMDLIGEKNVNLDSFGQNLKFRSMIPSMVKDLDENVNTADKIYNLLDTENEIFNLSGSGVEEYNSMSEAEKKEICSYIYKNGKTVKDPETLQAAFDISIINSKLDKYTTHADSYNVLNMHKDLLPGLNISDYEKLTTEKETVNMAVLNNRPYSSPSELVDKINPVIESSVKKQNQPSKTPSGNTGGTGSKTSGGRTNISSSVPLISGSSQQIIENAFADLDDVQWAQESINKLYKMGIVSGKDNGNFDPNGKVTREEFVKMVVEAAGITTYTVPNTFKDVKGTDWFNKYVSIASERGITTGIGNNKFGVGQNITRQDMMTMCMYLLPENVDTSWHYGYPDAEDVSDYAKNAVAALSNLKIVNGNQDGRLMPQSDCTRAEAAKIIYMILQYKYNY